MTTRHDTGNRPCGAGALARKVNPGRAARQIAHPLCPASPRRQSARGRHPHHPRGL